MPWPWLHFLVVVDNLALAHVHASARPRVMSATFVTFRMHGWPSRERIALGDLALPGS